jgi:hypothetical protein
MGMLIYVILHRLCLVNEQNAIINLKNDIVKNTQKPDDSKKISSDFSLENVESLQKWSKNIKKILIWNQEKNKIKINIFQKHF